MSKYSPPPLYVAVICAMISLVLLSRWIKWRQRSNGPLPPGPRRLPIIGNLFQIAMSGSSLWQTASEWGKTYGDMIYLEVAGFPIIILNSQDIVVDLLSKRSSLYSSRPRFIMPALAGWDWTTPTLTYGARLRKHRAILQKFFLSPDVLNYTDVQQTNCYIFLQSLLDSPEKYDKHAHQFPAAAMMMNTYGHKVQNEEDQYVQLGEESARALIDHLGYLFLDLFPWIQSLPEWFPGTQFRAVARAGRLLSEKCRHELYSLTKKKMKEGTATESMTTIFLGDASGNAKAIEDEEEFANVAAIVFLAGGDTSFAAIMNLVLAMLKYPEAMRRAREEIDRVVGTDRLPTFEDRVHLPYVNALCTEVLRWEVSGPLGALAFNFVTVMCVEIPNYNSTALPRCTTVDDEYQGYRIPAGTIILPNVWAIARNEDVYPDPLEFKPERWLPGGANFNSVRPVEYVFGYGRRICPGRYWAEHLLFITAASLLATFDIKQAVDVNGEPIPLNEHHEPSFVRWLGPSKCKIVPRSEKAASLIRNAAESL